MLDRSLVDRLLAELNSATTTARNVGAEKLDELKQNETVSAGLDKASDLYQQGRGKFDELTPTQQKLAGGAAAAGVAALLFSKNARRLAAVGGIAALGTMAYKAYQGSQSESSAPEQAQIAYTPEAEDKNVRTLITAMIAAANADGHISSEERTTIADAIDTLQLEKEDRLFVLDAFMDPKSVSDVAKMTDGEQEASEVYAVSALVLKDDPAEGRTYLQSLAMGLGLSTETASAIEDGLATA